VPRENGREKGGRERIGAGGIGNLVAFTASKDEGKMATNGRVRGKKPNRRKKKLLATILGKIEKTGHGISSRFMR